MNISITHPRSGQTLSNNFGWATETIDWAKGRYHSFNLDGKILTFQAATPADAIYVIRDSMILTLNNRPIAGSVDIDGETFTSAQAAMDYLYTL